MNLLLVPSKGLCSWRALLGDPVKHWKRGRSALELAVSWETAAHSRRGLPAEIASVLDHVDALKDAWLLLGIPEHKTNLASRGAASQSDFWALLRNDRGLISLTIEAKAGEPFDRTVTEWLNKDARREGRENRLNELCQALNISSDQSTCGPLRYQLFHRTTAAVMEAKRCGATAAVMLVQAFPGAESSWQDFVAFAEYLGTPVAQNRLDRVPSHDNPPLYIGWVSSPAATDAQLVTCVVANGENIPE